MKTSKITNKPAKQNQLLKAYKKHYQIVLMLVPGIILLILFNYVPMAGITIAFKDYKFMKGIFGSEWVGLKHFANLFQRANFGNIIMNTLSISVLKLLIGFPAPIILALMLNELRVQKLKKVLQTCTYLPHFFSWVVLAGIFKMVFSSTGPINTILGTFGIDKPLEFFSNGTLFRVMLIATHVWQSVGWGAIVYLAALSGVDESLYEAAYIDGAGRWKQTLNISIPCIIPTVVTVFILNVGSVMNAGYDQIYNMYNPTVYETADIIETYVMRALTKMDYGVGTAAGLFKSVIGMLLVITTNHISSKLSDNELGIM